jgi:hypothetical protein
MDAPLGSDPSVVGHADALGLTGEQVVREDVGRFVGVGRHKSRRGRIEGNEAPPRRQDRPAVGRPGGLCAVGRDVHAPRRVLDEVAHEDVIDVVGVAGNEVVGRADKEHAPALAVDSRCP